MPAKDYQPAVTPPQKLGPVALQGFSREYSDASHQHPTAGIAAAVLDTTAADIAPFAAAAAAGSVGLAADAGHRHPVPRMRAHNTGSQTLNDNTFTTLNFGGTDFDPLASFSGGNTYTCPRAGVYLVTATIEMANVGAGNLALQIFKNGVSQDQVGNFIWTGAAQFPGGIITDLISAAADDTITVQARQVTGGAQVTNTGNNSYYLAIFFIGN